MPTDLFEDHRAIIAAAEELAIAVRQVPPMSVPQLTQRRVKLGTLALAHLRAEEEQILEPLRASGRTDDLPEARAMLAELREGRGIYSDHIRKWTLAAIEQDRGGYADAIIWMVNYLKAQVIREEKYLYWPVIRMLAQNEARSA